MHEALCACLGHSITLRVVWVRRLVTGPKRWNVRNVRTIELGANLQVSDVAQPDGGLRKVHEGAPFTAIHMASQGYWQMQDEGRE